MRLREGLSGNAAQDEPCCYHWRSAHPILDESRLRSFCWALLALAQVHAGQVPGSIRSSRRAFALSQESKNAWVHVASTNALTYGLLDAGTYEEAFEITQHTMAFARTLPPTIHFQHVLTARGSTYHALQQWEEARSTPNALPPRSRTTTRSRVGCDT